MDKKIKKQAVKYILYEIQMLAFTHKKLNEKNINPLVKNAIIESFLIHAYNLFRFFYQGETERKNGHIVKRKQTDMIAEDYIEKRKYFKQNRTPKKLLKSLEKKRNKQLAHLTYNRVKMRGWDSKIAKKLEKTINAFFDTLSPETFKWFSDAKKEAKQRVQNTD